MHSPTSRASLRKARVIGVTLEVLVGFRRPLLLFEIVCFLHSWAFRSLSHVLFLE